MEREKKETNALHTNSDNAKEYTTTVHMNEHGKNQDHLIATAEISPAVSHTQPHQPQSQTPSKEKSIQVDSPLKKKRAICSRCDRPTPRGCICSSLPDEDIELQKCRVVVLQHPHEKRLKNRSLPLIQLCLKPKNHNSHLKEGNTEKIEQKGENVEEIEEDWCMKVVVGRRLGDRVNPDLMRLINETRNTILVYPFGNDVMSLQEGLDEVKKRRKLASFSSKEGETIASDGLGEDDVANKERRDAIDEKVTIVFIDATWKYAREMERTNTKMNLWPKDLIRVKLQPPSFEEGDQSARTSSKEQTETAVQSSSNSPSVTPAVEDSKSSTQAVRNYAFKTIGPIISSSPSKEMDPAIQSMVPEGYKPRRFDIRTPPTENHLSTAECVAWVLSYVENSPSLYSTFMKPLDEMVSRWHSFSNDKRDDDRGRNNGQGHRGKDVKRKKTSS